MKEIVFFVVSRTSNTLLLMLNNAINKGYAMPTLFNMWTFALLSLGLVLTPGPNMIYLISRSISQGKKAGFISLIGVAVGYIFLYVISCIWYYSYFYGCALCLRYIKNLWCYLSFFILLGNLLNPVGALSFIPKNYFQVIQQSSL